MQKRLCNDSMMDNFRVVKRTLNFLSFHGAIKGQWFAGTEYNYLSSLLEV